MPGILSLLGTSGGALDAFTQVLQVTQNNVANASTPGYARQVGRLYALPFDPGSGTVGGVRAGDVQSARDVYAESTVRRETVSLGQADQQVDSLTALNSVFDISGNAGLPYALNNLFQGFSAWAESPSSGVARQTVLDRAGDVATAFQQTAAGLESLSQETERRLGLAAGRINELTSRLAQYNQKSIQGTRNDAGMDALIYSTLEELATYVDFDAVSQQDGSISVLVDGQIPLVLGGQQFEVGYDLSPADDPPPVYPGATPAARVTVNGQDVTAHITGGQVGALLDLRNRILPSYLGDPYQAGDLNDMAKQFADRVNGLLTSGNISDGPPAETGVPLFTYDDGNAARSLATDPNVTADALAAIDPGPPEVSNGVPLSLSALAVPESDDDKIDGISFTEFYGRMASRAGAALQDAQDRQHVQESTLAQAKNMRQQMSGVSLDEEAMTLLEFQRAYQANSRLISVLDQLAQDTIDLLR
jgi:flagellar hook-associated protein 1